MKVICKQRVCAQSRLTLCDPMDCSPPGSSVHGIFLARILEWVAISSSRGSSWFRDQTLISYIAGTFFPTEPLGKPFVSSDNSQMNLLLVKWDINKYAQNWSGHIIISICGGYRARQTNDSRSRNLLSFPSWHCDLPRLSKEQPFLFYFLDAWPWLRRMSLKCLWNCYFRRKESRS